MLTTEDKEEIKRLIADAFSESTLVSDSIADTTARAVEVFGSSEKALRWLRTPVRALGDLTPLAVLRTREGGPRVADILGQIEHGVW